MLRFCLQSLWKTLTLVTSFLQSHAILMPNKGGVSPMAKAKTSTTKDKTKRPAAAKATKTAIVTPAATPVEAKITRVSTSKKLTRSAVAGELVLGSLVAELLGTFVLTAALLNSGGNVIIAGVTVMVLVMALSRLSGGHLNPAVTIAMWATKQISAIKAAGYVVVQVVGAMLALVIVTQFVNAAPVDTLTGQTAGVFALPEMTEQWRPVLGEALGALVFGLAVAAAVMGRKNSHESGFIVGGGLLVGLIIASLGSPSVLNPAVAVGLSGYQMDNLWTILAFAIAPVVGVVAGAWLYKLLQWDVTGEKELKD
jgi:glycerol uptake facilitator-like aquaporin